MPKKRVAPKGPFYFLMLEVQDRRKKQYGHCTLEQAKEIAGVEWQALSEEKRSYYEEKAKQYKDQQKGNLYAKFTSDGRPIALVLKEEEDKIRMKEDMIRDIDRYVFDIGSPEDIKAFKFYVISFNILCEVHGEYPPLEIGAIEYTIEHGFIRAFHRFIDPGEIPLGFASSAKDHSEATHGIPITGFEEGDRNYARVVKQLCDFFYANGSQQLPPLFCTEDHMTQTEGCLQWLKDRSGFTGDFQVWDILHLLLKLRRVAGKDLSATEAESILNSAVFDYEVKSLCSYHAEIDNKNCALGQCRRLGYKLSNALLNVYNVQHSIDYQHLPPRIDPTMNYEITQLSVRPSRGRRPMSAASAPLPSTGRTLTPAMPNRPSSIVPERNSVHAEYGQQRAIIPSAQAQASSGTPTSHPVEYKTASEAVMGVDRSRNSVPSLRGEEFPSLNDSMRSMAVSGAAIREMVSRGSKYAAPPRPLSAASTASEEPLSGANSYAATSRPPSAASTVYQEPENKSNIYTALAATSMPVTSPVNNGPGSRGHYSAGSRNIGPLRQQRSIDSQSEESTVDNHIVPEGQETNSQAVDSAAQRIAAQFPSSLGSGRGLGRGHATVQQPLAPVGNAGEPSLLRGSLPGRSNRIMQPEKMVAEFLGRGLGRGSAF